MRKGSTRGGEGEEGSEGVTESERAENLDGMR